MSHTALIWRDGELVHHDDATVHVLSHTAARGSQVFDIMPVVRVEGGLWAVGLRPHVSRFIRSCELMGMDSPGEVADLEQAVAETVRANPVPAEAGWVVVKLMAAWTEPAVGIVPQSLTPTVFIAVLSDATRTSAMLPERPVSVRSSTMPKIPAEVLPPSCKVAASYTPALREQLRSRSEGFDHTVFRTTAGDLAESTTLSTLVVSAGRVLAPPLDVVLDGITRRLVLDCAEASGIPVEVRPVAWGEVEEAGEVILCSSTHPVVPVGRLDQRALDAPGPVTRQLTTTVAEVLAGRHRLGDHWLTILG